MDDPIKYHKYFWHIDFPEDINFADVLFIDSIIRFYNKKHNTKFRKILDVPCGLGRLHKYLREFGYDVYGVDINRDFIQFLKDKYPEYSNKYFVGDMRNFKLNEKFDVILNWFTSFGYFDHKDNIKTLENFANHLSEKGIIILDYMVYNREGYHVLDHGDYIEIMKVKYKSEENKYIFSSNLYKKENNNLLYTDSFSASYISYTLEELNEISKSLGLEIKYVFPNLSLLPLPKLNTKELIRRRVERITVILSKL